MTKRIIGAGPSTSERKNWRGEIAEALVLTALIYLAMCALWGALLWLVWWTEPSAGLVQWFKREPRQWWAVMIGFIFPCLFGFITWARQELLDTDWTSLHGRHELSGIVPMTPIVRVMMLWRWLRGNGQKPQGKSRIEKAYDFLFGEGDDE
jgi:hypothetical protein